MDGVLIAVYAAVVSSVVNLIFYVGYFKGIIEQINKTISHIEERLMRIETLLMKINGDK